MQKQDRSAGGIDIGDHAQRMALVGKHERGCEPQAGQGDIFRREVARQLLAPTALSSAACERGVRVQGAEGLVGVEVRVVGDRRAPVVLGRR